MSGFVLTKDQQDLKRLAADFGKKVMRPAAKEYDLKGETPLDIYRQAVKIGFTEVALPKEFGGLGLGCTTQCVLTEELRGRHRKCTGCNESRLQAYPDCRKRCTEEIRCGARASRRYAGVWFD